MPDVTIYFGEEDGLGNHEKTTETTITTSETTLNSTVSGEVMTKVSAELTSGKRVRFVAFKFT